VGELETDEGLNSMVGSDRNSSTTQMREHPVGYFVWVRTGRGTFDSMKIDRLILDGMQQLTTKKAFDAKTVARFPLTDAEWKLSLDQLATKYPAPEQRSA
jgi:hypothetical protein